MILKNFVVFEGIDGSGTSTQISLLKEKFSHKNICFTAEPTGSPIGLFIRSILKGNLAVEPSTMAYLFATDRNEHVYGADGIVSKQKDGYAVVSDRYLFSSLAYQTPTCPPGLPQKLNEHFPLPEYLFYFDISPEQSLSRVKSRGETEIYETDAIQKQTEREYKNIIAHYKALCNEQGTEKTDTKIDTNVDSNTGTMHIIEIDATQDIQTIHKIIVKTLENMPMFKA